MTPLSKDQMDVILTVLTLEEFEEYQGSLETKIYHIILTKTKKFEFKNYPVDWQLVLKDLKILLDFL